MLSIHQHILRDKRVIDYAQTVTADHTDVIGEGVTETTKLTRSKAKLYGQPPLLSALETTRPKSVICCCLLHRVMLNLSRTPLCCVSGYPETNVSLLLFFKLT